MPTEIEGTHQIGDVSLYTKTWKTDAEPVAKLIMIHGFDDHTDRYYELFPSLASRGIEVLGFDQRGWGKSVKNPADKGKTGPTSQVISDIVSVIKTQLPSSVPIFVLGHSMGGGQALVLASSPEYQEITSQIRGWLLESPFIGFPKGFEPSSVTVFLGRLAGKLLPHMRKHAPLPPDTLTRDPEVAKSLAEDELLHGTGTLEGLSGMLDRTEALATGKYKLNPGIKALWLGHGTDDKGTSYDHSKQWFEKMCKDVPDKEFRTYEGWSHQLHADLPDNRHVFQKDVGDWILARVGKDSKL